MSTIYPPPTPSPIDLLDVDGWIASWLPGYVEERFGQTLEQLAPTGCPTDYWKPLSQLPEALKTSDGYKHLHESLKRALEGNTDRKGVFLTGPVGTGKTSLLAAWWHDMTAVTGKPPGPFHTARSLTKYLKGADQTVADRNGRMADLSEAPYLAIDDLGTEPHLDWDRDLICELIETRYANGYTLWATTNLTGTQLKARYGDRVADRLRATTTTIIMKGASKR